MTPRAYLDAVRKRCEAATAATWFGDAATVFDQHSRTDLPKLERIARLAEDLREAMPFIETLATIQEQNAARALFAALEELK